MTLFAATPPCRDPPAATPLPLAVAAPTAQCRRGRPPPAPSAPATQRRVRVGPGAEPAARLRGRGDALAEAQRLLGIDAGGQSLRARLAKAAPITAAQAAEAPVADAASGGTRPADASADGAAALAEALHLLGSDGGGQTPRVRLAKAAPASLDALISKIADTR